MLCRTSILLLILGLTQGMSKSLITKKLLLLDAFSDFLSSNLKRICENRGIEYIEVVSPYMSNILNSQGSDFPSAFMIPSGDDNTLAAWLSKLDPDKQIVCALSESDSGTGTAERVQKILGLRGSSPVAKLMKNYRG